MVVLPVSDPRKVASSAGAAPAGSLEDPRRLTALRYLALLACLMGSKISAGGLAVKYQRHGVVATTPKHRALSNSLRPEVENDALPAP